MAAKRAASDGAPSPKRSKAADRPLFFFVAGAGGALPGDKAGEPPRSIKTLLAGLGDVVDALDHQGILKLVILNGHGGNDFRQMVRELLPTTSLFICTVDWYRWIDGAIFEEPGDHAGEMETSLMQLLAPEWVLPLTEAGPGAEHSFKLKGLREGFAWAQRDWLKATEDTGAGNPGPASPEKGQRCLDHIAARLGDFLVELAAADVDDLYE